MKKTWISMLLALCLLLTTLTAASACCADACCTTPSGLGDAQTMEETCPCMMDGKGVDGCPCVTAGCGEDCNCLEDKSCVQDGMPVDDCACETQCACGEDCACDYEARLEMLEGELNDLFENNMDLWNKFFGLMDKQPDMDTPYADYLTEQLETAKEKFTEDEYKTLQQDIETIRRIDEEIAMLEDKLMPEENMMEQDPSKMFPTFEGMDLDGSEVTSDLFKDNSVTVVNFWFSGCAPCIAELGELNALNEELKLKGGAVIGINADTIGGDKSMIIEARQILEKKGAAYQNIYFPVESEAGKLTYSITAFPTTVVVDRNGRMIGEPILGGINNEAQMKALQDLIDETLARDMATLDKDMMMKPDGN